MKKSAIIGIGWTALILFFATMVGIIGRLYLGLDEHITKNSLVFIAMVRNIFPALYFRRTALLCIRLFP